MTHEPPSMEHFSRDFQVVVTRWVSLHKAFMGALGLCKGYEGLVWGKLPTHLTLP